MSSFPIDGSIQFLGLINNNISEQQWAILPSEGDTIVFDGASIIINVSVPKEYPFKPPCITLDINVFHPNINERKMCLDKVNNWYPKYTIIKIMEEILNVLMYPNTDTALNSEAAELYIRNRPDYMMKAVESLTKWKK